MTPNQEPDSGATEIRDENPAHRMLQAYEVLRAELNGLIAQPRLTEMLDEAMRTLSAAERCDDPLREMRAMVAGRLLDYVGQFLVATDPARLARPTRPEGYRRPRRDPTHPRIRDESGESSEGPALRS